MGTCRAKHRTPSAWVRTPADREAVRQGYYFDLSAAERVRTFFSKFLRHSKGRFAGQPFELTDCQFTDIIGPLFGWKRPDGTRRFRVAYIEEPKKNGKSTLCAGLNLYLLVADKEPGAEIYNGAVDKSQAAIVFNESVLMVKASKPLSARLEIVPSKLRIIDRKTNSFIQAMSADVETKEGLNAHGVIIDELHAHLNRKLWDTLRYAGSAREQPLIIAITTAGWDRTSVCYEQHTYAQRVLAGEVMDLSFFGYIRAADPGDDWTSPKTWRKANPSYGVTIKEEDMRAECLEAQESAAKENTFKRYRLNLWTEQAVRWIKAERWAKCAAGVTDARAWHDQARKRLLGRACVAGLDLGQTGDLTPLVLLFGSFDEGYEVLPWFWAPERGSWRDNGTYRDLYLAWSAAGWIEFTAGDWTDYQALRSRLKALATDYAVAEVAADTTFQGAQLCTELVEQDGMVVSAFNQGFLSMTAPCKHFEELVLAGKLRHGNHPVLNWMAANVALGTDRATGKLMRPMKPAKNSPLKIDGIVATIMALGRAMQIKMGSVYDDRGLLTL